MVGDPPLAGEVLGAGDLIGEHRRDEVLGLHALQLRRHLPAASEAQDRQRARGVPAPAHAEHRRVEQGLHQDLPHRPRAQIAEHVLERKAVGRAERQDDGVLRGGGLQLDVEIPAKALAESQPPGEVDPPAERRVQDQLHAAALVEEALQDDRLLRRHDAERRPGGGQVVHDLLRGLGGQADVGFEKAARGWMIAVGRPVGFIEAPLHLFAKARHRGGQLRRPGRRLADPERDARRLAAGVLDADLPRLDLENSPGRVAELEDVARHALDGEVFVDRPYRSPLGLQDHGVVGGIGNGAARSDRREPRPLTGAQPAVDPVVEEECGPPPPLHGEPVRKHLQDIVETLPGKRAVRVGTPRHVVQVVGPPFLAADRRDDLLGQNVERRLRDGESIELAAPHRVEKGGALDELVARQRKETPHREAAHRVPGPPDALQQGGDRARRADLADQVDRADVDAELQ